MKRPFNKQSSPPPTVSSENLSPINRSVDRPVNRLKKGLLAGVLLGALLLVLIYLFREPVWRAISGLHAALSDREQIRGFITGFGAGAPVVFMAIQILQVLFAPIPGEATGFIGGFLFGTLKGFIYSSVGLTVGSWINFLVGRVLGKRFVRRLIPEKKLDRLDAFLKRQGIFILLIMFIFPGFPKDYLCLLLGISTIPIKVFLVIAAIGRMPGTFMLSLQGAFLFEKNYTVLAATSLVCIVGTLLLFRYRELIYAWIERVNGK